DSGLPARDVSRRGRAARGGMARPIWIEPGVQLESFAMGLLDPEGKRVVPRLWRATLLARQVLGPGFELRCVERVGRGPHLEDQGGEPDRSRDPNQRAGFFALRGGRKTGT